MSDSGLTSPACRSLIHFTPLRYPGGKAKLAEYVKRLIKDNKLLDGDYLEPYAGGAAIAMELLFHEYVSTVHINDVSRPIFAFWDTVLADGDWLCEQIENAKMTVEFRDAQKNILLHAKDYNNRNLGFATLYLNRTNRSGILNGGMIGGRNQDGPWKLDARFNKVELIHRIKSIGKIAHRVELSCVDAIEFLKAKLPTIGKSLIYLDPPYYRKGRDLYFDFYKHEDHLAVANFVRKIARDRHWIVSYDNVPEINKIYEGCRKGTYTIGYSARSAAVGSEVMFFSENMHISPLVGPVKAAEGFNQPERHRPDVSSDRATA